MGTVRYLTNNTGTVVSSGTCTYEPFGKQTAGSTTASNYTFQTEQKDSESGLTYLRARYYDPTLGRFTAQDPLSGTIGDPAAQNGYNYANANPINYSDPLGLAACSPSQQANKLNAKVPTTSAFGSVIISKDNQNDFRMMSEKELNKYEINAHEEKYDLVGNNISKYDIYRSKSTGDLYVAQKGLPKGSEVQPLNLRITSGKLIEMAPGEVLPSVNGPKDVLDAPFKFPDIFGL